MNTKYFIAVFFITSLGATSIAAASAGDTYGGISLGKASPSSSIYGSAIGWKIFGGYTFSDILAVEGGYTSFAEMNAPYRINKSAFLESTGFEIAAVGKHIINSQSFLFGKVGLLAWNSKVTDPGQGSDSSTGTNIFLSIGGQYEVSDTLAVRGSWDRYTIGDGNGDANINFLTVSTVFDF
ncbi:MAG: porin family protein [Gammaproteobacteria bacterium]|nr:porin family protein [Gammaproteobacteria bacterium]